MQLATLVMKHEGFDFTVNVWDEKNPKSDEKDVWAGNIAVPNLIFDDKEKFEEKMGNYFSIKYEELTECLIFLNSGGLLQKHYVFQWIIFMNILNSVDSILIKIFPSFFVLEKIGFN